MIEIGELYVFSQKFTTTAAVDADPTLVEFWLREGIDGTELYWAMTGATGVATVTPTGMNALVKDSVGDFHLNFNARKPERLTAQWIGVGTVLVHPPETVFVRHSGITAIDHP
jgi:hypothetical protein